MHSFSRLPVWGLMIPLVASHGMMTYPPSIRDTHNPHSKGNAYYDNNKPLARDGSDFPCGAGFKDVNTEYGKPVATWSPGGTYNMTTTITAHHDGGSCQIAMSADQGKNWKVIQSDVGNCPPGNGDFNYDFTLPEDSPTGDKILFSWAWLPNEGLREMFHSCAVVSIKEGASKGGVSKGKGGSGAASWANAPKMFEANIGGEYCTYAGRDPMYPEPGEVVNYAVGKDKLLKPAKGKCPEDQSTKMINDPELQVNDLPKGGASSAKPAKKEPTKEDGPSVKKDAAPAGKNRASKSLNTPEKSPDAPDNSQASSENGQTSSKNGQASSGNGQGAGTPSSSDQNVQGSSKESQNADMSGSQNSNNDDPMAPKTRMAEATDDNVSGRMSVPSSEGEADATKTEQPGQDGGPGQDNSSRPETKDAGVRRPGRKGCASRRRR